MELSKIQQSETYMEYFEDEKSYVEKRLAQLNVSIGIDLGLFKMKPRGGFSRQKSTNQNTSSLETSFLYERRLFRVDVRDMGALTLMENFKTCVMSDRLPPAYDKNDTDNRAG